MSSIYVKSVPTVPVDMKEVFRYAISPYDAELEAVARECEREAAGGFTSNVCYGIFDLKIDGDCVEIGNLKVRSHALSKNLSGCRKAVVFAATVGLGVDRLITKYGRISPLKSVFMQALGAERIEALCDAFCDEMARELQCELKPRFSAGYGDFDIEAQRDIFKVLQPEKRIGLTLNESLIMSPSKSVTAIVGVLDK